MFALEDTKKLAEKIASDLEKMPKRSPTDGAFVIGLHGDLGAGKTTFMQFFGAALGVGEKMLSPTFVIEKIYKIDSAKFGGFDHLIHIDAYRIENPAELETLGWREIAANPRNIIAVEWADKVAPLLPADHLRIEFSHHGEKSRIINVKNGQRADATAPQKNG